MRGVMIIVVPQRIQPVTTFAYGPYQARLLRLVFADQHNGTLSRCLPRGFGDFSQDVVIGIVVNVLRRVESQSVEMEFADPIGGVLAKKIAHGPGMRSVEIDRLPPVCIVLFAEIEWRELGKIVAIWSYMVVNNVENHSNFQRVRSIYEGAHIIGPSIQAGRSIWLHAVITPAESSGKVGDRHDLNQRDARVAQIFQLLRCGIPTPSLSERPQMQFVENLTGQGKAAPI